MPIKNPWTALQFEQLPDPWELTDITPTKIQQEPVVLQFPTLKLLLPTTSVMQPEARATTKSTKTATVHQEIAFLHCRILHMNGFVRIFEISSYKNLSQYSFLNHNHNHKHTTVGTANRCPGSLTIATPAILGIFDTKDNLESQYAEHALYELFKQIFQGRFYEVPLGQFEQMTGLSLTSHEGGMKIDLPPLRQFLNRLLALRIDMQNLIFERFELLLSQQIEAAIAAGVYEVGVETLRAEHFNVENQEAVYTHPATGSVTNYLKIERTQRNNIKTADEMLEFAAQYQGQLMINEKSGNAAVSIPTHSIFDSDGGVIPRVLLVRSQKETRVTLTDLESSTWKQVSTDVFIAAWLKEVYALPKFTTDYLHLVTGILLPIWKILPQSSSRVFRLQTSDGAKVLGRVVNANDIQTVAEQLGMKNKLLSPAELVSLVLNEGYTQQLPGGVTLRRSFIAGEPRIELVDALSLAEKLVAVGCFTEIIQWRKRVFVPTA